MDQKPAFAPIPTRALNDLRLTARQFRVLGAVAAHDRLRKNAQGCWVGRKRLAQEAGCNETHLSNALSELRVFGYISTERYPMNRRTMAHRVIYTEQDRAMLATLRANYIRVRYPLDIGDVGNRYRQAPKQVPIQNANSLNSMYERVSNILGEAFIKNSVETGSRESEAISDHQNLYERH